MKKKLLVAVVLALVLTLGCVTVAAMQSPNEMANMPGKYFEGPLDPSLFMDSECFECAGYIPTNDAEVDAVFLRSLKFNLYVLAVFTREGALLGYVTYDGFKEVHKYKFSEGWIFKEVPITDETREYSISLLQKVFHIPAFYEI